MHRLSEEEQFGHVRSTKDHFQQCIQACQSWILSESLKKAPHWSAVPNVHHAMCMHTGTETLLFALALERQRPHTGVALP